MKIGLVAAAVFAFLPAAHAQQSGCDLINSIVAAAPDGFKSLQGEEIDDGWFEPKVWLVNAEECGIDLAKGSLFYCVWGADSSAAANTKTVVLSEAVKLCLLDWTQEDIAGRLSSNNLKIVKGVGPSGAGAHAGTRMEIYTQTFEDSPESQTWLEVSRK